MAVINSGMRRVIKIMAVTSQTAQFLSLMPKPKDFATRLVGDVVYLSGKVMKLSEDVNKLLDQYASIPTDYIMNQMNSITGSATRIVDRVSAFAQNATNQGIGLASNTMELISETTGTVIDAVKETSNAVISLGGAVAHTSSLILARPDVAEDIHGGIEEILKWNGEGFDKVINVSTEPINNAIKKVNDANTNINEKISDIAEDIKDMASKPKEFLENILSRLKDAMDKLSNDFDRNFPLGNVAEETNKVVEALKDSNTGEPVGEATVAILSSVGEVFKNFSLSRVIKAFGGVMVQTGIVALGLDELPPIDFERMLSNVRGSIEDRTVISTEYLERAREILGDDIKDMNELSEELRKSMIPAEAKQYSIKEYNEFRKQYKELMASHRNEIRELMKEERESQKKEKKGERDKKNIDEEEDSAIKEQRKLRRQAKAAKQTDKFKDVIKKEISNLGNELKYRSNEIQADWNNMMDRYEKSIKEIKAFFQNGGDGDMFIDDICDRINQDCDDIKELCKNLIVQLMSSTIKVVMPADVGPVFPNPAYKIADFWMDIKTIIKFIKDLIEKVIDIINCINKLARIMLNGINNLKDIIDQLMELIGIKWFMDLIQNIIDMFGAKMTDARELLENMLAPVYYRDTEEYDNTMEILEEIVDDGNASSGAEESFKYTESLKQLGESNRYWRHTFTEEMKEKKITKGNVTYTQKVGTGKINKFGSDEYDKLMEELEKKGDEIVAYKSPILDPTPIVPNVIEMTDDGKTIETDIKFIGWHFFHPILRSEYQKGKLFNKVKNKIIKKASKTSNKRSGGIKGLQKKWRVKGKFAYEAFYWYTYYTLDLEKDCYVGVNAVQDKIYIDSVSQQQNGSVVELTDGRKVFVSDNMVRSGDYVTVEGIKYRVK